MSYTATIEVPTREHAAMINIAGEVRKKIAESGISSGICVVFNPHTTAALTINENADPDVVTDMLKKMDSLVPWREGYRHAEGNSAAHVKASLFGPSLTLIIDSGRPLLGTWQGIYFCEFDGPRRRKVFLKIIGD